MGKRGPAPVELDLAQLEKLCQLNCTNAEIAAFFKVTERTIERRIAGNKQFREIVQHGRAYGKLSLRRKQMEVALAGNTSMLIWLGKQLLGQVDRAERSVNDDEPAPLAVSFEVREAVAEVTVTVGEAREETAPAGGDA